MKCCYINVTPNFRFTEKLIDTNGTMVKETLNQNSWGLFI